MQYGKRKYGGVTKAVLAKAGLTLFMIAGVLLAAYGNLSASEHATTKPKADKANGSIHAEYRKECGGCHLAYPARLLPRQSWQTIMNGLSDHFGDNAELDSAQTSKLTHYLVENAKTRHSSGKYGKRPAPLRITELGWFRHEHNEIPSRVRNDPKVGSLSLCDTCHQDAKKGRFNEDHIHIPGYGRWDD